MSNEVQTADQTKDLIAGTLQELGLTSQGGDTEWGRAKINGTTLDLDGNVFVGTSEETTLYIRFDDIPLEYQGMWITPQDSVILERPDASETYCKSYFHIDSQSGDTAEDGTDCHSCVVRPRSKKEHSPLENKKKCSWRSDVLFHWVNKMGEDQDARTWTLSLATTSVIELKGSSSKPTEGYINEDNFMIRLAKFAIKMFPDKDPKMAIALAGAALKAGRVIASAKVVQQTGGARNFPVIVLEPVNVIIDETTPAQVEAAVPAEATAEADTSYDDLPF